MSKQETIWVASQPELFGSYGLTATGRTEQEAKDAFWQGYLVESASWNSDDQVFMPTFRALDEHWGINIREYEIGHAYLGDNDLSDYHREEQKEKQKRKATKWVYRN